jgi:hypothetical protein
MPQVHVVMLLAVLQYFVFGLAVGRARGRYGIPAPATAGHPDFERYYRIHMNPLEQLAVLLPITTMAMRKLHANTLIIG